MVFGLFSKKVTSIKLTIAAALLAAGITLFVSPPANAGVVIIPGIDGKETRYVINYNQQEKRDVYAIVFEQDGSLVTEMREDSRNLQTYVYFSILDAMKACSEIEKGLEEKGHKDIKLGVVRYSLDEKGETLTEKMDRVLNLGTGSPSRFIGGGGGNSDRGGGGDGRP